MRIGVNIEWATYWDGERIQCPYCKETQNAETDGAGIIYPVKCPNCNKELLHFYCAKEEDD